MKDAKEYLKIFAENDEYKTSFRSIKLPLPPALLFYSNLLRIILYSNYFARKGIYNGVRWANSSIDIVKSLEWAGIKFHFSGMNNLRKVDSPVVLTANHMSALETMVLPSIIQPIKTVVYIIKEELASYPLFGTIAKARDPIIVGRENPREDLKTVLEEGTKKISEGKSIIIFPQKTRTQYFEATSFNSLGIKLAKRNNVPVIPIALLTDAWGNGKLIKDFGKIDPKKEVKICFGGPIFISSSGNEEHQQVINFITNKLKEWGRTELVK